MLTGFLFCAHLWADQPEGNADARHRWTRRTALLIRVGAESETFGASWLFAVHPEAVGLAAVIAALHWRRLAAGAILQHRHLISETGHRLGQPDHPLANRDVVAHWMKFDSTQAPRRADRPRPSPTRQSTAPGALRRRLSRTWAATSAARTGSAATAAGRISYRTTPTFSPTPPRIGAEDGRPSP